MGYLATKDYNEKNNECNISNFNFNNLNLHLAPCNDNILESLIPIYFTKPLLNYTLTYSMIKEPGCNSKYEFVYYNHLNYSFVNFKNKIFDKEIIVGIKKDLVFNKTLECKL